MAVLIGIPMAGKMLRHGKNPLGLQAPHRGNNHFPHQIGAIPKGPVANNRVGRVRPNVRNRGEIHRNPQGKQPPPSAQDKKPKKPKPRVLAERLANRKTQCFMFFTDFSVPFDNNQAERDIRMFKVKQKVSGCFRTKDGADDFATIMSFIGTARKRGFSAFVALRDALNGKPFIV